MSRIEDALAKANQLRENNIKARKGPEDDTTPSGASKGKGYWRYAVGIPLVLAACFGMYRLFEEVLIQSRTKQPSEIVSEKSRPAVQPLAPKKNSAQIHRLPTSVPLNFPDAAYSFNHPGWQRYKTEALEFRVFRDQSVLKAIQVISHQKKSITDDFLLTFLRDVAGKDSFKVQSGQIKDGYYIEKGTAGDTAEVLVYRNKSAGEIKALVVAYL